jgi:RHS repeat-associated protein
VSVLVQILHQADQTTQFVYDGDGNLIKQINQDGSKTIYIDGFYEEDRSSGGSLTNTRVYYPAGGAMRVNGVLYYDLRDNLGSAAAVASATRVAEVGDVRLTLTRPIDSSGNIVGQERYYPFGATRVTTGSVNTDRLYTGQRSLAALGLMDYHARFYEPTLGVFIQPDTMMPSAANPQSLNRYSYVLNDPINLNDPSGYKPCWATKKYTCNNLTKKLANQQYSLYSSADQPAVAAFFASQGINVGTNSGGGVSSGTSATDTYCSQNAWDCNGAFLGTGGGFVTPQTSGNGGGIANYDGGFGFEQALSDAQTALSYLYGVISDGRHAWVTIYYGAEAAKSQDPLLSDTFALGFSIQGFHDLNNPNLALDQRFGRAFAAGGESAVDTVVNDLATPEMMVAGGAGGEAIDPLGGGIPGAVAGYVLPRLGITLGLDLAVWPRINSNLWPTMGLGEP